MAINYPWSENNKIRILFGLPSHLITEQGISLFSSFPVQELMRWRKSNRNWAVTVAPLSMTKSCSNFLACKNITINLCCIALRRSLSTWVYFRGLLTLAALLLSCSYCAIENSAESLSNKRTEFRDVNLWGALQNEFLRSFLLRFLWIGDYSLLQIQS